MTQTQQQVALQIVFHFLGLGARTGYPTKVNVATLNPADTDQVSDLSPDEMLV
jgi:hypothetical protein